jgi:hypothetical protein
MYTVSMYNVYLQLEFCTPPIRESSQSCILNEHGLATLILDLPEPKFDTLDNVFVLLIIHPFFSVERLSNMVGVDE